MHVLIIGGAGMIGAKLADRLLADGTLRGEAISRLTLFDTVRAADRPGATVPVDAPTGDLASPGQAELLMARRPDVIFHLAAVVSGEAEADFEKGYRVNVDGTRALFEAIRRLDGQYHPRVVFTSSIAVFGAPFPNAIADDFHTTPLTSYGAQKAICELLLADYSRRGFLDGVGIRLPTISVRPGRANRAASGFFSGIVREPLNGIEAVLPVPESVRHWHASPRAAIAFLIHAATIDTASLGARRTLTMPGLSVTVGEQIAALRRVAGEHAVSLIRPEPDSTIAAIVAGWPENFSAERAERLGFRADTSFDAIIQTYIDDELGGRIR